MSCGQELHAFINYQSYYLTCLFALIAPLHKTNERYIIMQKAGINQRRGCFTVVQTATPTPQKNIV